jgi:hypothetical protein
MTAEAIIAELEALPPSERSKVLAHFDSHADDSWIPESFKRSMQEASAGKLVDMERVLRRDRQSGSF